MRVDLWSYPVYSWCSVKHSSFFSPFSFIQVCINTLAFFEAPQLLASQRFYILLFFTFFSEKIIPSIDMLKVWIGDKFNRVALRIGMYKCGCISDAISLPSKCVMAELLAWINFDSSHYLVFFSQRMPYFHHFLAETNTTMNNKCCNSQGNNNGKFVMNKGWPLRKLLIGVFIHEGQNFGEKRPGVIS